MKRLFALGVTCLVVIGALGCSSSAQLHRTAMMPDHPAYTGEQIAAVRVAFRDSGTDLYLRVHRVCTADINVLHELVAEALAAGADVYGIDHPDFRRNHTPPTVETIVNDDVSWGKFIATADYAAFVIDDLVRPSDEHTAFRRVDAVVAAVKRKYGTSPDPTSR